MPPKPIAPASRVSRTCGFLNARSSLRPVASRLAATCGTSQSTSAAVRAASTVTSQYAERQPACWPSQVAAGTPATLATARPSITPTDRPATSLGSDQVGRHEGGDPEVGAVREAGEEPGSGQRGEAGGQGAGGVADQEHRHQADQQLPAREPGTEHRDQRGADHHADGVRRDHVAGRRDGHARPRKRSGAAAPSRRTRWCRSRSRPSPARTARGRSAAGIPGARPRAGARDRSAPQSRQLSRQGSGRCSWSPFLQRRSRRP